MRNRFRIPDSRTPKKLPLCRYRLMGACCYDEIHNPGLREAFICRRLAALMREWDDFLDRAEVFGLSERQAAGIWDERKHESLLSPSLCRFGSPARGGRNGCAEAPGCRYLLGNACLLSMPRCPGSCARLSISPRIKPGPLC